MGGVPAPSGPPGDDTDLSQGAGFAEAEWELLVGRLAVELGKAWNRALAAGADPRRLVAGVEEGRRRIRTASAGHSPAGQPGSGQDHADRELPG